MNITLWILQVLLAVAFAADGVMMLAPPGRLPGNRRNQMLPRWFQIFIGASEVLAAIGLTLPGMTRIMPGLVPAAAAGVIVVMISATALHLWRSEYSSAATTFVLLLIATFRRYNRWRSYRIAPRRRA